MKEGNFHLFHHPYFISASLLVASFFLQEIAALNWPRDMVAMTGTPQGELLLLAAWIFAVAGALFFAIGLMSHDDEEIEKPKRVTRRRRVA